MKPKTNPFLRSAVAAALALGTTAHAAPYTWDGGTNTWNSINWNSAAAAGPTANTDTATINAGQVTINGQTIDSAIFIGSGATVVAFADSSIGLNVNLGGNLTGSGTLTKTGDYSLLLQGNNSGFSGTVNATNSHVFFQADSAGSAAADWTITTGAKILNNQSGTGHVIALGSLAGDSTGYLGSNSAGSSVTFEIGGKGSSTSFAGQIVDTPSGYGGGTTALEIVGGNLTLTGVNTYTGTTTVNAGTLTIGADGAIRGGGAVIVENGATLRSTAFWGTGGFYAAGQIGAITVNAGGTLTATDGANGITNGLTLNGGTVSAAGVSNNDWGAFSIDSNVTAGGATTSTISAELAVSSTRTFEVGTGSTLNISGAMHNRYNGGDGGVTKSGNGTMTLTGANSYTGTTAVNVGTLQIGNGGTTGTLGSGNVTIAGNLTFNRSDTYNTGSSQVFSGAGTITKEGAGELIFNGANDHTNVQGVSNVVVNNGLIRTDNYGLWNSNLNLTVNGSGQFEMWNNGSVTLANLSGNGTVQNTKYWGRTQTLTVAAGSFSGTITDLGITSGGGGTGDTRINLVKNTAGTLTLSGTNDYHGTTTVNEGTLNVSGSIANSTVTVNNAGTVLASGITGTVGKGVTVNNGAILAAGGQNTVGAATVGSDGLSFASGSIFDWDLTTGAGDGSYDTVSVTGTLAITSGAQFNVVSNTAFSDGFWNAAHTWDIFGGKAIDNFLVTNFLYSGSATAPAAEGYFTVSGSSLNWTAVPEPTSALAGLLITAGLLRRRRQF